MSASRRGRVETLLPELFQAKLPATRSLVRRGVPSSTGLSHIAEAAMDAPMDDNPITSERLLAFLPLAERLKRELRHSWLSDGRRESVAEHTWFITLIALLSHKRLEVPVQLDRVLAMAIVHDLGEAIIGDIPFFEVGDQQAGKAEREATAMDQIAALLPSPEGDMVRQLWLEFEEGVTPEAKFVRALDHLEVQAQHNLADLATWEPVEHELVYTKMDARCAHDPFLRSLLSGIRSAAESKMQNGGVDVEAIRDRVSSKR